MGFVQSVLGATAQGGAYDAKKRMTLIEGEAAKNAAYAKATGREQNAKAELAVVGENLKRAAGNRRREMAAARNSAVASGFASEGNGDVGEELVGRVRGQQMADMARSGSVASMNALEEAVALRRGGDAAMRAAEAEAAQYRAMARLSRTGAWINAMGSVGGAVAGAAKGAMGAEAFNLENKAAIDQGLVRAKDVNREMIYGGYKGADAGNGMAGALNPMMTRFNNDTWSDSMWGLLLRR